jgi:hypothetical protein
MIRDLLAGSLLVAFICLGGCFHRARPSLQIGDQLSLPRELDSVGIAKWVDAQRRACPGRLNLMFDEGGAMRYFDARVARYQSSLVAVQCVGRQ